MNSDLNTIINQIYVKGYSFTGNFLSGSEIEQILNRFNELRNSNEFKKAGIGKKDDHQQNSSVRGDEIHWLEEKDQLFDQLFFSKIRSLIEALNHSFFLGIRSFEFHLAHYKEGTFYKKHKDVFRSDDARKISVVCYLNKDWKKGQGGELVIYTDVEDITIEPTAGTLVIFESNIEHEVLPSKTDRFSITGWLKNTDPLL